MAPSAIETVTVTPAKTKPVSKISNYLDNYRESEAVHIDHEAEQGHEKAKVLPHSLFYSALSCLSEVAQSDLLSK